MERPTLWSRLKAIRLRTIVVVLAAIVVLFVATGAVVYGWDYTNSPYFCGTTCHPMPPHYASYLRSPRARVACVECHIGRTSFGVQFERKAVDVRFVWSYLTGLYTLPLYAKDLQPARETCEKCHWPDKFSEDRVQTVKHFEDNAENTLVNTLLVMKTGGGTAREGRGYGIHWHTQSQVWFIATDPLKQNIPWIQVIDANGNQTVYTDIEKPLTADEIAKAEKHRMDCIDCHNRVSHSFKSPAQAMDEALALQRIDATIPAIHTKGIEVLSAKYTTFDDANQAIDNLDQYYRQTYPDYYTQNAARVQAAVTYLKQTYVELVFPTQDLSWTTHPDNLGHKNWPGCFRCHDGKHFTADNQQAIRLECNICHTLPQVQVAGGPALAVSVARGEEPESHSATTWLAQHRTIFNASCQNCHDTRNAGGNDNSSFCSNSACHGTKWTFAGLDAPALSKIFPPPVPPRAEPGAAPPQIPHPIGGSPDCQICHGPKSIVRPYPSDHVGRTNDVCLACHQPTIPPTGAGAITGGPPIIPHDLAGRAECLGCHASGQGGIPQVPQFHKDYKFANTACLTCHKPGVQPPATPTPAPTTAATEQPTAGATATTQPAVSATPTASATIAATPTSAPQPSAGAPPTIPADHAGRTACTVCHASGVGGAPKLPADHAGRDDTTCTTCHKPK